MKNILEMNINEMASIDFDCACGKHHTLGIKHILIGKNVLGDITKMAKDFKNEKIFLFSDDNTFKACGNEVFNILQEEDFNVKNFVYPSGEDILIPDEKVLGRLFMEMERGTKLIIAVGSGTINDLAKYMSSRSGIPYIIVCTAPSMDGYASDGAPLICDGFKIAFEATLAYGILGDTEIMKKAPMNLIQAGFGDVLGKLTALADWELSRRMVSDYYCETCVLLVQKALDKVIANAKGLKERDEAAILYLIEALTLTGVAMGLIGISRPASGAEHMLSHYWEMDFIKRKLYPELHGIKVGIGTPVICRMFELLKDEIPKSAYDLCPSRDEVVNLLKTAGCKVSPKEVGVSKELFYESLLKAYTVRKRYSILQYAVENNKIEQCASIITKEIYG